MTKRIHIKLGTRQSPLAMVQANLVKDLLQHHHSNLVVDIVQINTTGDIVLDKRLADIGGKGLFTKELDMALYDGRCDIAVHSLKDVETILPKNTELVCILPREDIRDVMISRDGIAMMDLPHGATVGTTSLRRQAQLLQLRPDFKVILFRGNVGTRLKKLKNGEADATMLALAGLNRLDKADVATEILDPFDFIPAVGQGAIAVQAMTGKDDIVNLLKPLHCEKTAIRTQCERAMLNALDGTCKTPVGGMTIINGDKITLIAFASTADGKIFKRLERTGNISEYEQIGRDTGLELRHAMGDDFDRM